MFLKKKQPSGGKWGVWCHGQQGAGRDPFLLLKPPMMSKPL